MPETQWMTLRETADMMKTLPEQVTQMCEDGKLEYYMEDGRYFVSRESIDLFMHPPIVQPAPSNPDTNGSPRRQYGRAPHETEPSPEAASDSQTVNSLDAVDADAGLKSEDTMEDTPGLGMEETPGRGDEVVEAAEDAQPEVDPAGPDDLVEAEGEESARYVRPANDPVETDEPEVADEPAAPENLVEAAEDLAVPHHEEKAEEPVEVAENVQSAEDLQGPQFARPEPSIQDGETEAAAEAAEDPGEPDVRVAEILADLRAALSRHAREHQAFCDEIAALADALESTLSQDGDKTSELTREISSLLARYTRR